jgi:nucleoside-diphosphate-sugar epimerase
VAARGERIRRVRVFLAGATGVIGRNLVPLLVDAGHEVIGLARTPERAREVEGMGAEVAVADALDRDAVVAAVGAARPDAVVHQLTAIPPSLEPRKYEKQFAATNALRTQGTANLLAGAAEAGAERFLAQSIAFAYAPEGGPVKDEGAPLWPDPPANFAAALAAVQAHERQVLDAGGTVLRYGQFYGPGTSYAPDGGTAEMVRKRRFPIVGQGGGMFSFISVADAARATALALERDARGVLNIVDDEPAPVREWLPAYADALGAPPPRKLPEWLARLVGGSFAVQLLTETRGASNERAKRELGWQPDPASWREGFRHQT